MTSFPLDNSVVDAFFKLLLLAFLFSGGGIFAIAGSLTVKECIGQLWISGERIEAVFSVFGLFFLTVGIAMIGIGAILVLCVSGVLTL